MTFLRLRHATVIFVICSALVACASKGQDSALQVPASISANAPGEQGLRNDWGLAISGGGVRSALYAVGALKALHEQGALAAFDAISSVSGGSYAAYWLFSNRFKHLEQPMGNSILSDRHFARSACELVVHGNFVTNFDYIRTLGNDARAVDMYEASLQRTFGAADPRSIKLHELADATQKRTIPLWIVNTSTVPAPKGDQQLTGVVELTPFMSGSRNLGGYNPWASGGSPSALKSVAISGAALAPILQQSLPLPRADGAIRMTALSDGGHTENLGAYALIRRGIKNIIVIDAEMDRDLEFGAYHELKSGLDRDKLTLEVSEIKRGQVSASSIMVGTVKDSQQNTISTVYYIKMSLPQSIERLLQNPADLNTGKTWAKEVTRKLQDSRQVPPDNEKLWWGRAYRPVKCEALDQVAEIPAAEILRFYLATYKSSREHFGDFPHFTTLDQSFYTDQSMAYLGLGYLQACELSSHASVKENMRLSACKQLVGSR